MKNVITYIFIAVYFLLSINFSADVHFCKGKFISAAIIGFPHQKCCEKKISLNKCCKNIQVSFKKSNLDTKTNILKFQLVKPFYSVLVHHFTPKDKQYLSFIYKKKEFIKPPPIEANSKDIIVLNCVYRI